MNKILLGCLFVLFYISVSFSQILGCKVALVTDPGTDVLGGYVWLLERPDCADLNTCPIVPPTRRTNLSYGSTGHRAICVSFDQNNILWALRGDGQLFYILDGDWHRAGGPICSGVKDFEATKSSLGVQSIICGDRVYLRNSITWSSVLTYPGISHLANDPYNCVLVAAEDGSFWEIDENRFVSQLESLPMRPVDLCYDPTNYRVTAIVTNGRHNFFCYFDGDVWTLGGYAGDDHIAKFTSNYRFHGKDANLFIANSDYSQATCYQTPPNDPNIPNEWGPLIDGDITR